MHHYYEIFQRKKNQTEKEEKKGMNEINEILKKERLSTK
jgi:hypothetical protein